LGPLYDCCVSLVSMAKNFASTAASLCHIWRDSARRNRCRSITTSAAAEFRTEKA
jgi:hypothetical protein